MFTFSYFQRNVTARSGPYVAFNFFSGTTAHKLINIYLENRSCGIIRFSNSTSGHKAWWEFSNIILYFSQHICPSWVGNDILVLENLLLFLTTMLLIICIDNRVFFSRRHKRCIKWNYYVFLHILQIRTIWEVSWYKNEDINICIFLTFCLPQSEHLNVCKLEEQEHLTMSDNFVSKKDSSCIEIILDVIFTKPTSLCTSSLPPSKEPHPRYLAPLLLKYP